MIDAAYEEEMVATVNNEGNMHEVILRGVNSANSFVLHNAKGAKAIESGKSYTLSLTEISPLSVAPGDLTKKTKADLLQIASDAGIETDESKTKAEIVEALEAGK